MSIRRSWSVNFSQLCIGAAVEFVYVRRVSRVRSKMFEILFRNSSLSSVELFGISISKGSVVTYNFCLFVITPLLLLFRFFLYNCSA